MNDLLPEKSRVWRNLEKKIATVFSNYGFDEIRTPILERTELFLRGLGEVTDIVEKEMYSFEDRLNGKTYSLRPENTAAVVRASVQHSLTYNEPENFGTTVLCFAMRDLRLEDIDSFSNLEWRCWDMIVLKVR